jgi:hypothetical protein
LLITITKASQRWRGVARMAYQSCNPPFPFRKLSQTLHALHIIAGTPGSERLFLSAPKLLGRQSETALDAISQHHQMQRTPQAVLPVGPV